VSAINPSYALDASGNVQQKNKLILYQFHGGANQLWKFVPDNQGNYSIINLASGGALEIPNHTTNQAGTQCLVGPQAGSINEKWKIVPGQGNAQGKGYVIQSAYNSLVLDISQGQVEN